MKDEILIGAINDYVNGAEVPTSEFDAPFVLRMIQAMMVSYHKYGKVADAYPEKFNAASDVRTRMAKYRETGNKHYLVDAANFAMIEAMRSSRDDATYGDNGAADSPGRNKVSGRVLVQETNDGTRILARDV